MLQQSAQPVGNGVLNEIGAIAARSGDACICARVRKLSRIITQIYDDELRPLGITASQFTLLCQLAPEDGITAAKIGRALDIEKSGLSRNLQRLVRLGHLTIDPSRGRKGRRLHLTPKGAAVMEPAQQAWEHAQARVTAVMGRECRAILDDMIARSERLA